LASASASRFLALATQEFFGLGLVIGLTLSGVGRGLGLIVFWPH